MAKYQQYEEYKDSGVEWLGEIPKGWNTIQVGRLYIRNKRTGFVEKELLSVYRDYGVIPKSSRDDNNNKPSDDLSPYQLVKPDDLVMNKMKAWQGSIAISEYEGIVSPAYFVYEPNPKLFDLAFPRYVHYLLRSPIYITQYMSRSKGIRVNQWDLDPDEFKKIELLLPSKDEQSKIFEFLDHETAQIDTLIEKQQTLIQLLKEKRQAVISHAVTKGLNPDAPMKDSGVEWLGEVPEHWSVIKLSNYAIPLNGDRGANYPSGNDFVDEGVFFISTSEVVDGYIKTDTASKITLKKYNQLGGLKIKKGDIIYCLRGSVGKSGICTFNEGTISSSLMGIRSVSIEPYYLKLLLASSSELQQRSMLVTGSVSANLSAQNVMGYRFAIPEKVEQLMIIAHVENSLEKIDILLSKATQAIQLMQERRTALISAAVTGKIDVRGWRASE
ncbi:restriction endonuclease subunit S [Psychrobacter namhaensis]|uniref:restriction endonuclease subunit S n=1 Tax=Psychrobacter namhaensis TaxID=292734 RepID=UPI003FD512E8